MPASLPDGPCDLLGREGGIPRQDSAFEWQVLKKLQSFHYLAAVGRDNQRADAGLKPDREGLQHMHARRGLVLAATQPLAVDRNMPERSIQPHGRARRPFQIGCRDGPEDVKIRRMTRCPPAINPQHRKPLRRQPTPPAPDRTQVIRPGQHRRKRKPHK